jgi:hypothetical protein
MRNVNLFDIVVVMLTGSIRSVGKECARNLGKTNEKSSSRDGYCRICCCYFSCSNGCHLGGGLHSRLVPYDILTEKEKQKDLKFYQDLIKYLNTFGYRVTK